MSGDRAWPLLLVLPAEPDYWPPASRDVVLTLDDVLVEDGAIAPFSRSEQSAFAGTLLAFGTFSCGDKPR